MIVLGWLVLVVLAAYFWFATIGGSIGLLGFTGKVTPWMLVPLAVALFLSYKVWEKFPFQLVIQ